ncbi:hypothetical protein [aff. Roholtiella sp. LEGE 12411]|uniref:hypothetical protein n=1 Tax=aff. Roholtiella sp. LEGE 12411 TaxID=1828822 RepID=UPI001880DB6A|nr:hypothetical protein [aff. Roholtiella sp. LEGE 12411]MBE9035600.1 hypothetical protein [aff. Roholtiella sp. LEGE 12411]
MQYLLRLLEQCEKKQALGDAKNEKLHPQGDGVFGNGEWGLGKKLQMPNAH